MPLHRSFQLTPSPKPTLKPVFAVARRAWLFIFQRRKPLIISLCVMGMILGILSVVFNQKPIGYFGSYKLFPHADNDVLGFTNGVVAWETCCGNETVGTYSRSPDGSWIWRNVMGGQHRVTNEFVLSPGLFWLTCYESSNPTNVYRLPRKLSGPRKIYQRD